MAKVSNKLYNTLVGKLEGMSDGGKKYTNLPLVAATFQEVDPKALKTDLEAARANYLNLETEARKAYDAFAEKFKEVRVAQSKNSRIIKGIFGRTAEELKDFGIQPERTGKAKPKPPVK